MPEFFVAGPNAAFDLAIKVQEAIDNGQHDFAVDLCLATRDAIVNFTIAMALVTSIQNQDKPVIALSPEEAIEGQEHDPGEMLHFLADGFPGGEVWEDIVNKFKNHISNRKADKVLRDMPSGEIFVDDILNAKKID